MAIKPIDTEVFVQNLKQAYTILRQNILICNTMVEMINNFNSLNTTGEQNASDIEELQGQVSTMNSQLSQLETNFEGLNQYVYNDISQAISQRVEESDKAKIVYGTAPTSATPFEYQVVLSDEQSVKASDRSLPTTAWVGYKVSTQIVANPTNEGTEDLTKIKVGDTTYNIPQGSSGVDKNAYFEWSNSHSTPEDLTNVSQLTGYTSFDFRDIRNCPEKIICRTDGIVRMCYEYRPMVTNGYGGYAIYTCNAPSTSGFKYMKITLDGKISFSAN